MFNFYPMLPPVPQAATDAVISYAGQGGVELPNHNYTMPLTAPPVPIQEVMHVHVLPFSYKIPLRVNHKK